MRALSGGTNRLYLGCWLEKGSVENHVGLARLRVRSYDELNGVTLDRCLAFAKAHMHPERPEQSIWECFEEERGSLVRHAGRIDGFHVVPASVSKTAWCVLTVTKIRN